MNNKTAKAMIRTAVEKGIYDMKEEPKRSLRNLVDLGEHFSFGMRPKGFFNTAQSVLSQEDSAYYTVGSKIIESTDTAVLISFGINLGYNSLIDGANTIRNIEEEQKCLIPWSLTFNLEKKIEKEDVEIIKRTIHEGYELGMFSHVFFFDEICGDISELLKALASEKESAFFIFIHPNLLNGNVLKIIRRAKNIAVIVDVDAKPHQEALNLLDQNKCFYGGYTRYTEHSEIDIEETLKEYTHLKFLFFLEVEKELWPEYSDTYEQIKNIRNNLNVPVIPFDFYNDISLINKNISDEAFIVNVDSDFNIELYHLDDGDTFWGKSIEDGTLNEILIPLRQVHEHK